MSQFFVFSLMWLTPLAYCAGIQTLANQKFFDGIESHPQHHSTSLAHSSTTNKGLGASANLAIKRGTPRFFLHKALVKIEGDSVVVDRPFVNLRRAPSRHSLIENLSKKGDRFLFLGERKSSDDGAVWVEVTVVGAFEDGSSDRWAMATVIVKSQLNLRDSPPKGKSWGKIIGKLLPGDRVLVDFARSSLPWYHVRISNRTGFAHSRYIKLDSIDELIAESKRRVPQRTFTDSKRSEQSPPSPPKPNLRNVLNSRGTVEIQGVPMLFQGGKDPYDPKGGKGWRPWAYCGPTSLQMVMGFHGLQKSRDELALTRLDSQGNVLSTGYKSDHFRGQMYAKGQGSSYGPMVRISKHFGFKNTRRIYPSLEPSKTTKSKTSIRELLRQGRPQIVSVLGELRYTDGSRWRTRNGHILVITGMTEKGDILVNDPAKSGGVKSMSRRNFLRIWRGFTVDVRP
jgi:hypothetical protein